MSNITSWSWLGLRRPWWVLCDGFCQRFVLLYSNSGCAWSCLIISVGVTYCKFNAYWVKYFEPDQEGSPWEYGYRDWKLTVSILHNIYSQETKKRTWSLGTRGREFYYKHFNLLTGAAAQIAVQTCLYRLCCSVGIRPQESVQSHHDAWSKKNMTNKNKGTLTHRHQQWEDTVGRHQKQGKRR